MAIGDLAALAGLAVYNETQDRRLGYQNDNQRGDEIAAAMQGWSNLDGSMELGFFLLQWGIGKITGTSAATIFEDVAFPMTFGALPSVFVQYRGSRAPGAFNPDGLAATGTAPSGYGALVSLASFRAYLTLNPTFGTQDYYYQWFAIGERL